MRKTECNRARQETRCNGAQGIVAACAEGVAFPFWFSGQTHRRLVTVLFDLTCLSSIMPLLLCGMSPSFPICDCVAYNSSLLSVSAVASLACIPYWCLSWLTFLFLRLSSSPSSSVPSKFMILVGPPSLFDITS